MGRLSEPSVRKYASGQTLPAWRTLAPCPKQLDQVRHIAAQPGEARGIPDPHALIDLASWTDGKMRIASAAPSSWVEVVAGLGGSSATGGPDHDAPSLTGRAGIASAPSLADGGNLASAFNPKPMERNRSGMPISENRALVCPAHLPSIDLWSEQSRSSRIRRN
jgi:hypothetical protein